MDSLGAYLFYIILIILFYFLPYIIGFKKRDSVAIFLLNFLLGWTVLGWIAALIWAVTEDKPNVVMVKDNYQNQNTSIENKPKSVGEQLLILINLRDSGVLTKEEFEEQKMKLLK